MLSPTVCLLFQLIRNSSLPLNPLCGPARQVRRGCREPARPGGGLVEGQNAELGGVSSVGSCAWGSRRLGRWRPGELQKLGGLGVSPAREAPRSPEEGTMCRTRGRA